MSNIKPDSIIALLDAPEHIQAVLDASLWISARVGSPIGLLHSSPSSHKKKAINYSGCLNMDEEDHILHDLADEEYQQNLAHKNAGKQLLKQSQQYCIDKGNEQTYPLHRQSTIEESITYIDKKVELIITGGSLTCKTKISKLIRPTHSPILVTNTPFKRPESALFAFDDKATCHHIVERLSSGSLSKLMRNMCLHIVMVAEDTESNKDALRETYAKLTQAGIKCKKQIIASKNSIDVPTALLNYQQDNSLEMLISGAFGQSRLLEWLNGSETEQLLNKHQTPYLLFPKVG